MATENDNEKGVSPQRRKGGVRRWYGAARGLALSFWAPFVCIASSLAFGFSYLPLVVAIIVALVGALVPGRPHIGRSAWRIVREVMAWLFAAVHLAIVALWLYFATGAFDFVIIPVFRAAVCDADRIVIRDGGGLCHSKPDEEPSLFEITNKADIASFNEMFKFSGRTMPCCCCGYPGIDWWRDGRRVVVSALHHGHALRVEGFVGDLRLTVVSSQRIQKWLEDNCGLTEDEGIPKYQYCRHERDIIEDAAQNWATAGVERKPTMDDLRDEFKKNGKEFPACPAGGEYSLTYGEDGRPEVKCTAPRHD